MAKIIAIANQKGGVGKTTTADLAQVGKKTLMVDLDPQGNTTSGFGCALKGGDSVYDALMGRASVKNCLKDTMIKKLKLLGSDIQLAGAEVELVSADQREYYLKKLLGPVREDYDFILIDCPALLELLTLNALCAADTVLIPVQCEYLALEGLSELMGTLRMVRRSLNPSLEVEGVVLTMYDGRTNLSLQVANAVKKHMKQAVYRTAIPRNVRLSEAPSHGMPVLKYDPSSKGAYAYRQLAEEIMEKNPKGR